MQQNNQILKNTFVLYLRLIIVSIVGLISSRLLLDTLGASDYGLYNVVGGIVFLIALINNIMISASYRFIAFEIGKQDEGDVNKIFNVSLTIHIVIAVLILLIAETVGIFYIKNYLNIEPQKLTDAIFVFRVSIISTIISIVVVPFQGLLTAKEKFSVLAGVEIIRSILSLGVVYALTHYEGNKLLVYSILILVISCVPPIIYFLYSIIRYAPFCKWNFQSNFSDYKELIVFSGWILFGAIAGSMEVQGSAILINMFFGTIINAGLGIANQVNNMVKLFSQSINQAVIPQLVKSYSGGFHDRTERLVIFTSKYTFFLMMLPAVPIFLQVDFLLLLWLKEVPVYTAIFIKTMLINALIYTTTASVPSAIQATGKIRNIQVVTSLISLTGLPLAYVLFKLEQPPYYLFFVYSFAGAVNFCVVQFFIKNILNISFGSFYKDGYSKMLWVVLLMSPLFIINSFLDESISHFLLMTTGSVVWLLLMIYVVGTNTEEKQLINTFANSVKQKFTLKAQLK